MTATSNKYNKLNGTNVSNTSDTILFPADLLGEGQNGACMTLFINTVKNGKAKLDISGATPANPTPTLKSSYGEIPILNVESRGLSGGKNVKSFSNTFIRSNQTITLAMPKNLNFDSKVNWSKVEFKSTAAGIDQVTDLSKTLGGFKGLAGRIALNTLGSVAEKTGASNAADLVEFGAASIANNYAETLFKSVDNRQFVWQWTLTPRNAAEVNALESMLRMLRFHQLPEFDTTIGNGNAFLLYPSSFDIVFWMDGAPNKFIPRISTCALTSVETNYQPNGTGYVRLVDGSPQSYNLSLTFAELMTLHKGLVGTTDSSGTSF